MDTNEKVAELAKKHCPPHNAINDAPGSEEGFYHCEECAEIIHARFAAALREAMAWRCREDAKVCDDKGCPECRADLSRIADKIEKGE